jgi:LysM repeat protein
MQMLFCKQLIMKNLSLVALLLTASVVLNGQNNTYLMYDDACMNRLEYNYISGGTNSITSYAIPASNGTDLLILGVGMESKNLVDAPKGTIKCTGFGDFGKWTKHINSKSGTVFIVRPMSGQYVVTPVSSASFVKQTGNQFSFDGYSYRFAMDAQESSFTENLSQKKDSSYIFLKSREEQGCKTSFKFSYEPNLACACGEGSILHYVSGLGFLSEVNSLCTTDKPSNGLTLTSIDGRPVAEVLDMMCSNPNFLAGTATQSGVAPTMASTVTTVASEEIAYAAAAPFVANTAAKTVKMTGKKHAATVPTVYNTAAKSAKMKGIPVVENPYVAASEPVTEVVTTTTTTQVNETAPVGPPAPCTTAPAAGRHIVQKGETLFSIARANYVSIADVQRWNNLKSNQINLCQSLVVVKPVAKPAAKPVAKPTAKKSTIAAVQTKAKKVKPAPAKKSAIAAVKTKKTQTGGVASVAPVAHSTTTITTTTYSTPVAAVAPTTYAYATTTKEATSTAPTSRVVMTHTVQKGESLYGIARAYGFTLERFALMNGLTTTSGLYVGQVLVTTDSSMSISEHSSSSTVTQEVATAVKSPEVVYYSRPVEHTQESAAGPVTYSTTETVTTYYTSQPVTSESVEASVPSTYTYETTTSPEAQITSAPSEVVYVAPAAPTQSELVTYYSGVPIKTHRITEGDTYERLSRRYKVSVAQILEWNQLAANEVLVNGQLLVVQK